MRASPSAARARRTWGCSTTGTRNTAPAEARTVLGPNGSTPPQQTMPAQPAASADRISVPALPGSLTSASTSSGPAAAHRVGQHLRQGPASASRRPRPTGWGVTASVTRAIAPGASSTSRAPAAAARAASAWSSASGSSSPSRTNISTWAPASRASADERRALDHEPALLAALAPPAHQASQLRDQGVLGADRLESGRPVSPRPTRWSGGLGLAACWPGWPPRRARANAAGSVTARSARTLRSTSTPATCRPSMNRL